MVCFDISFIATTLFFAKIKRNKKRVKTKNPIFIYFLIYINGYGKIMVLNYFKNKIIRFSLKVQFILYDFDLNVNSTQGGFLNED